MFYAFELALIAADPPCEIGEQPVVCRLHNPSPSPSPSPSPNSNPNPNQVVCRLASEPHRAPCQTPGTVAQAERAMRIIWLSLWVWGAMLAFSPVSP